MDILTAILLVAIAAGWVYLCWKKIIPDPWAKYSLLVAGGFLGVAFAFLRGGSKRGGAEVELHPPVKVEETKPEDVIREPVTVEEVKEADKEVSELEKEAEKVEVDEPLVVPPTEDKIVEDLGSFVSELEGER